MATCRVLTKDMLADAIELQIDSKDLDWSRARQIADEKAREKSPDPMLMAWFDKRTGDFSPQVECCSDEKPGWLVYAESRGANVVVDINDLEYVFVYHD